MNSKQSNVRKALTVAPFFLSLLFSIGCKRVDDELLTQQEPFSGYAWFNNELEREFPIASSYNVPPTLVNETSLISSNESSNTSISACYIGDITKISTDTIFLLFNGTGGNMDFYYNKAKVLYHSGANRAVFTIDYRGNGKSAGEFSFLTMKTDASAALNWLRARGVKKDKLVVYGQGLGAVAAVHVVSLQDSTAVKSSRLLLENPTSKSSYLYSNALHLSIPQSYASEDEFDNLESMKQYEGHAHFLISEKNDKFESEKHGILLYNNYQQGTKSITSVSAAKHSDLVPKLGINNFTTEVNSIFAN